MPCILVYQGADWTHFCPDPTSQWQCVLDWKGLDLPVQDESTLQWTRGESAGCLVGSSRQPCKLTGILWRGLGRQVVKAGLRE